MTHQGAEGLGDVIPSLVVAGLVLALLPFSLAGRACGKDSVALRERLSLASLGMYSEETNFLTQASSVPHMPTKGVKLELTLTLLSRHLTHAEVMCFLREEDSSETDMLREGSRVFVAGSSDYLRDTRVGSL
jgi:hypothetical protein